MPPKRKKIESEKKCDKGRRFGFNLAKDLVLLNTSIKVNPWQLGSEKWKVVADALNKEENFSVTARTARERVELLVKKLRAQELSSKTGTEEQQTKRGELLQNIISMQEESRELINKQMGASDSSSSDQSDDELMLGLSDNDDASTSIGTTPTKSKISKNKTKEERLKADKERDEAFLSMQKDIAPQPSNVRKKRTKLSVEEDFIKSRQEHEIDMDVKRLQLEQEKHKSAYELEQIKLDVEKERLVVELKREERLAQESQRSHDLAMAQIKFQQTMYELLKGVNHS